MRWAIATGLFLALVTAALAQLTINVVTTCGTATLSAGTTTTILYMDTTGRLCANPDVAPPSVCDGTISLNGCPQPMLGVM